MQHKDMGAPRKYIPLGARIGRLTVVAEAAISSSGHTRYLCRCSCGQEKIIGTAELTRGKTKTCGCLAWRALLKDPGTATFRRQYSQCRANAKIREIEFDLTFEQWKAIAVQPCTYCGAPPQPRNKYVKLDGTPYKGLKPDFATIQRAWVNTSSIDRYDNNLGYSTGNCVPACDAHNRMKMDLSIEQFFRAIASMYEYMDLARVLKSDSPDILQATVSASSETN